MRLGEGNNVADAGRRSKQHHQTVKTKSQTAVRRRAKVKSLNEEITPDAWVYFLNSEDDGTYYGSVFDHSLKYVKDGYVYSLDPEPLEGQTPTPFSEAELGK